MVSQLGLRGGPRHTAHCMDLSCAAFATLYMYISLSCLVLQALSSQSVLRTSYLFSPFARREKLNLVGIIYHVT